MIELWYSSANSHDYSSLSRSRSPTSRHRSHGQERSSPSLGRTPRSRSREPLPKRNGERRRGHRAPRSGAAVRRARLDAADRRDARSPRPRTGAQPHRALGHEPRRSGRVAVRPRRSLRGRWCSAH